MTQKVPCVNVRQFTDGSPRERSEFVTVFGKGLQEFGFVVVEGHGVSAPLIQQAYAKLHTFFALSEEVKKSYEPAGGHGQRGYTGFGKEHAKHSNKGDLKEFWHVGREEFTNQTIAKTYAPNLWADNHVAGFKDTFLKLYNDLDIFARTLLEATSLYLGLPGQTLPRMIENGNSILRALHYPAVSDGQAISGAVRAAAHEDINFITILCEATESGLELLTRDGKWLSVESTTGQMVVDSGDMLSRICNNIIPSTTHRVINPPGAKNVARYSMPYFVHPYNTCHLEVLDRCRSSQNISKYAPIIADEFLHQRLREIGLTK